MLSVPMSLAGGVSVCCDACTSLVVMVVVVVVVFAACFSPPPITVCKYFLFPSAPVSDRCLLWLCLLRMRHMSIHIVNTLAQACVMLP